MKKRRTTTIRLRHLERQRQACEMRMAGQSADQIGARLGITPRGAQYLITRGLARIAKITQETTQDLFNVERARAESDLARMLSLEAKLDALIAEQTARLAAAPSDEHAANRLLRALEAAGDLVEKRVAMAARRCRLLGLDVEPLAAREPDTSPFMDVLSAIWEEKARALPIDATPALTARAGVQDREEPAALTPSMLAVDPGTVPPGLGNGPA